MIEIEQDDHVAPVLDEPLRLFDHHLCDLDVAHRGLVEGRGHHLAIHRTLHVRHFFRTLVDEKHDQIAFRMIGGDGLGDVLQEHRLASARWRDDERALPLADRRHNIDDAGRQILSGRILDLELQALVGIERRQIVEMNLVPGLFRIFEVDRIALEQGEVPFPFLRTADDALDRIAGPEPQPPYLGRGYVNIVGPREIIRVGRAQEGESVLQDLDNSLADDLHVHAGKLL